MITYTHMVYMCCVPFWIIFRIGIGCLSEKCAVLKHVSHWQCANFVIWKPQFEYKVLKHKNFCKETKSKAKLLHLFICFSALNAELLQMQWVKNTKKTSFLWNLDMADFAHRQSEACFKIAHFFRTAHHVNLKHVSGWHMFQNGTQHKSKETCDVCHKSVKRLIWL